MCVLVVSHQHSECQIELLHTPSNSMPAKTKLPKNIFAVMSSHFDCVGGGGGAGGGEREGVRVTSVHWGELCK